MTASEIQEAVGMSRQAAYGWLDGNAWRVREVGKGRNSAKAFVLADSDADLQTPSNFKPTRAMLSKPRSDRNAPPVTSLLSGDATDLRVGAELTVSDIRLEGGSVVVVLRGDDGELTVQMG